MLVEKNVALQPFNTFGIAARAHRLARIGSEAELQALIRHPDWSADDAFVLGGGSNIVLTGDVRKLVQIGRAHV